MVKNVGGNKTKARARKVFKKEVSNISELVKEDEQEYAFVKKKYGGGVFDVICYDKITRKAIARGSRRNKFKVDNGSLILVSLRDFEDAKCDILYSYTPEEIDRLIENGLITNSFAKQGSVILQENRDDDEYFQLGSSSKLSNDIDNKLDNTEWYTEEEFKHKVNTVQHKTYDSDEEINIDDL